jgi:ribosome maturation factor RimP
MSHMSASVDIVRLNELCERSLAAVGYELVEVEYARDQGGWVLRVYIDRPLDPAAPPAAPSPALPSAPPPSTISHADCELASQQLGATLDVEDLIPTAYRLEVSSPGVRRPLRRERDFARFVGRGVRVELEEPRDGRKRFVGVLRSAASGVVAVDVDGLVFELPISAIKRARLEVEF